MFELAKVGVPISIVGLLYMFYVGRRLIPERAPIIELTERFGVRPFLSEIVVESHSALVGKTLAEANVSQALGLNIIRIIRKNSYIEPRREAVIEAGDLF